MSDVTRRIEEETADRLVVVSESHRPLWQIIAFSVILVPMLILLLLVFVVTFVRSTLRIESVGGIFGAVGDLVFPFALIMGVFHLLRRVLPQKSTAIIDKGRGIVSVKESFLVPTNTTSIVMSEQIGVGYVRTLIGQKRAELLDMLLGWWGWLISGGRAKKGHKLVVLRKDTDKYMSIVLYTVRGFLSEQDMAIVRKIGKFLETKAITKGTMASDGEAFQVLSGKDLGAEVEVEDFSA